MLQALVVAALVIGGIAYINLTRVRVPEVCQTAGDALQAGDHQQVIDTLLQCLDEAEDLPSELLADIYYVLGNAYSSTGNHDQAVRDYTEALHHEPNQPWALNNRCWSYGLMRRGSLALADCEQALRLLPDQPEILDSRALAHWVLGDVESARRDLDRAHRRDRSFPPPDQRFREFEEMF